LTKSQISAPTGRIRDKKSANEVLKRLFKDFMTQLRREYIVNDAMIIRAMSEIVEESGERDK